MKNKKLMKSLLILGLLLSVMLINSCMGMMGMCGMGGHSGHNMQNSGGGDTSIIRKGIIDVNEIDINKDGKVFQDPMHWDVISDNTETCPLCGMALKEVTLQDARDNLRKNGFKVK
ncbi:MAG: heavy metal-binding domain-containing protein [Candidatus Kapabacteria bacterium]|nr:heavy metal-binding domain-containing protein [Candidatus Kapabacteria bacterium]